MRFTPKQLRLLQLQQQGLWHPSHGPQAPLQAIERLGYVQIDSINVVERAHHHVLFQRIAQYQPSMLDTLLASKQIFEYWDHAAAYLPMSHYRFSLYKKQQLQAGRKHWFARDDAQMQYVLDKIRAEGPLKASDFEKTAGKSGPWWDWQPSKKALEQLFMQGDLMVLRRERFQKVYDLTERVLPSTVDTRVPTEQEMADHLISRYLGSHGVGQAGQMAYLRSDLKNPIQQRLLQQTEAGLLERLVYQGQTYFHRADLVCPSRTKRRVWLLNPFDNLVIQRQRLKQWFEFDYQIEVYVPAHKRQVGYYSLPILYGDQFIGQLDVKADRAKQQLLLQHLVIAPQWLKDEVLPFALAKALLDYAAFNQCQQFQLIKAAPEVERWFEVVKQAANTLA